MKKAYVGIDVSKSKLDVTLLQDGKIVEQTTILNRPNSIKDFIEYLHETYSNTTFYFGYEATSNYMIPLEKILDEMKLKHKLLNPYILYHYFKAKGIQNKNDKVDSYVIALYLSEQKEEFFKKNSNRYRRIFKPYITTLEQIKKQRVALKNMLHSQKEVIDDDLAKQLKDLEEEFKRLQKEVEKRAKEKLKKEIPEYKELKKELQGVGDMTLLYILPYIADNYDSRSAKQFVSFFGLNPVEHQSGSSVYKAPHISKRGESVVRKLLFLSALSAIKTNKIVQEKYTRLIKNGKTKKQALVACATHLLRAIYFKYIQLHQRFAL